MAILAVLESGLPAWNLDRLSEQIAETCFSAGASQRGPEFKLKRLSDFSITIPSIYMQAAHRQMAPYIVVSLVWLDEKFKQLF
jgi:hypothetical protein